MLSFIVIRKGVRHPFCPLFTPSPLVQYYALKVVTTHTNYKTDFHYETPSLFYPSDPESSQRRKKKKGKFSLPWWMIFPTWALLWVATLVSVAFVTFYGISFGDAKCKKWITSLIVSIFTSIFLTQPVKVRINLFLFFFPLCIISRECLFKHLYGLFTLKGNGTGTSTWKGTGTTGNNGYWSVALSCTSVNIWYYTILYMVLYFEFGHSTSPSLVLMQCEYSIRSLQCYEITRRCDHPH